MAIRKTGVGRVIGTEPAPEQEDDSEARNEKEGAVREAGWSEVFVDNFLDDPNANGVRRQRPVPSQGND
jgi:hypothetical protein